MTLYRALDDLSGAGLALTVLGEVAFAEGNPARAEQLFDESEAFLRAIGSRWNLAANLSIRAVTRAMRGDHARSIALLREGLALALRLHGTQIAAYSPEGLAGAPAMLEEGRRAAQLFGAAEALRERSGSAIGLATLRELRERHLAALRARFDADDLEAEWSGGRAMDLRAGRRVRPWGRQSVVPIFVMSSRSKRPARACGGLTGASCRPQDLLGIGGG